MLEVEQALRSPDKAKAYIADANDDILPKSPELDNRRFLYSDFILKA
jgi:hypothetical protein